MSVRFDGVKAGFKVRVDEVCNQGLTTVSSGSTKVGDEVSPLVYAKMPEKVGSLRQEIVISRPYATDVLSPSSYEKLSLTVYKNGKPIKDVNGRELKGVTDFENEIKFVLEEFGKYSVMYNYTDGVGKESTPLYQIITVVDVEAPVLVYLTRARRSMRKSARRSNPISRRPTTLRIQANLRFITS